MGDSDDDAICCASICSFRRWLGPFSTTEAELERTCLVPNDSNGGYTQQQQRRQQQREHEQKQPDRHLADTSARRSLRMRWGHHTPPAEDSNGQRALEVGLGFRFAGVRYALSSEAGRGAHCTVWQCVRVSRHGAPESFALKVHNTEGSALKREAGALTALAATASGAALFPELLGMVRVHGRDGLAMPLYGPDIYQLQKMRQRKPFPPDFVWALATQLLSALEALEEVSLVHADIKPQNILLHSSLDDCTLDGTARIVLIDLGSCLSREQLQRTTNRITCAPGLRSPSHRPPPPPHLHPNPISMHERRYVQSRWYRAPEVILWSSISHSADVWSVGCVIAEVALGVPLLPGESEYNQLTRIVEMLGAPPRSLLDQSPRAEHFFELGPPPRALNGHAARAGEADDDTPRLVRPRRNEPELVRYLPYSQIGPLLKHVLPRMPHEERGTLLSILKGLLRWEAPTRLRVADALSQVCRVQSAKARANGGVHVHPNGHGIS